MRKLSDSLSKNTLKEIEDYDSLSDLEEDKELEDTESLKSDDFVINILNTDGQSHVQPMQLGEIVFLTYSCYKYRLITFIVAATRRASKLK